MTQIDPRITHSLAILEDAKRRVTEEGCTGQAALEGELYLWRLSMQRIYGPRARRSFSDFIWLRWSEAKQEAKTDEDAFTIAIAKLDVWVREAINIQRRHDGVTLRQI